jgi:hypothetical protein
MRQASRTFTTAGWTSQHYSKMDEHYNTWDEKSYESEDSTLSGASTVVYELR